MPRLHYPAVTAPVTVPAAGAETITVDKWSPSANLPLSLRPERRPHLFSVVPISTSPETTIPDKWLAETPRPAIAAKSSPRDQSVFVSVSSTAPLLIDPSGPVRYPYGPTRVIRGESVVDPNPVAAAVTITPDMWFSPVAKPPLPPKSIIPPQHVTDLSAFGPERAQLDKWFTEAQRPTWNVKKDRHPILTEAASDYLANVPSAPTVPTGVAALTVAQIPQRRPNRPYLPDTGSDARLPLDVPVDKLRIRLQNVGSLL